MQMTVGQGPLDPALTSLQPVEHRQQFVAGYRAETQNLPQRAVGGSRRQASRDAEFRIRRDQLRKNGREGQ